LRGTAQQFDPAASIRVYLLKQAGACQVAAATPSAGTSAGVGK